MNEAMFSVYMFVSIQMNLHPPAKPPDNYLGQIRFYFQVSAPIRKERTSRTI